MIPNESSKESIYITKDSKNSKDEMLNSITNAKKLNNEDSFSSDEMDRKCNELDIINENSTF